MSNLKGNTAMKVGDRYPIYKVVKDDEMYSTEAFTNGTFRIGKVYNKNLATCVSNYDYQLCLWHTPIKNKPIQIVLVGYVTVKKLKHES
jgi:hypothetical protein